MDNKIYMLAHFGNFKKKPVDGGETSARRFLETLRKQRYEVEIINRKSKNSAGKTTAKLYAALWGVVAFLQFFLVLFIGKRKSDLSLSICYCGSMMPFDALTARMAKCLGYKHVMYIKGGRTKTQYENGSARYKKLFKEAISASSLILTEGEENVELCNSLCNTTVIYFPNYTEDGFAPEVLPNKPAHCWNFIYFGRICPEKNTLLTVEVFNRICNHIPNSHLYIVGKGKEAYLRLVKKAIADSDYKDQIQLFPAMKHEELKIFLLDKHFFLFPSAEPNEGHSNSMNEAMSCGVVPIVSNNNFLPSIVGENRLVVSTNDVNDYVDIVKEIIENGDYIHFSRYVFNRVKSDFTQNVVESKLIESLKTL